VTTFGLVHGAYHGGACWDLLVRELQSRGHDAIAMDLPCDDPDAGIDDYVSAAVGALRDAPPDVVLVGHSMGGLTIPVVGARRPVGRLVFLAALVVGPGRTLGDVLGEQPDAINVEMMTAGVDNGNATASMPVEAATRLFYEDCTDEAATWAASLLRPQGWKPSGEPSPIAAWPDVPCTYIACQDDRTLTIDFQRHLAKIHDMDLVELPGSHSPFVARPAELAGVLTSL
jgi:pimeloyl-ACP methyl ester carboxylesterase